MTLPTPSSQTLLTWFALAADRTTPFTLKRWGATAALFGIFVLRILWIQAFYIIAYGLG